MSATQQGSALAGHRDTVTERIRAGESFGDIEDSIEELDDLTTDQKAALWLYAFTLRDRGERQLDSGAHLLAVL